VVFEIYFHIKTDMAVWDSPSGGMFLWMTFPDVENSEELSNTLIYKHHILLVAGAAFKTVDGVRSNEVRISYTLESDESMEKVKVACFEKEGKGVKRICKSMLIARSIFIRSF